MKIGIKDISFLVAVLCSPILCAAGVVLAIISPMVIIGEKGISGSTTDILVCLAISVLLFVAGWYGAGYIITRLTAKK